MDISTKIQIDVKTKALMSEYRLSPAEEITVNTYGSIQTYSILGEYGRSGWIIVVDDKFKLVLFGNLGKTLNCACYKGDVNLVSGKEWFGIMRSLLNAIQQRERVSGNRSIPFATKAASHKWYFVFDNSKPLIAYQMLEVKNV